MRFHRDGRGLAKWFSRLSSLLPANLRIHMLVLALLLPLVAWLGVFTTPASTSAIDPAAAEVAATDAASPEQLDDATAQTALAPVWSAHVIARGDTLSGVFQQQGIDGATLQQILALGKQISPLANLRAGDTLQFQRDAQGQLLAVQRPVGSLTTLVVERGEAGWQAHVRKLQPKQQSVVVQGEVNGILSTSLAAAGLPSGLANEFADIFRWKVDFRRDMRPGASFAVVYQKFVHDGKVVGQGPIEAAELTNAGKTLRVYRFEDGKGGFNYYTEAGESLKPSILRTPIHYTRISSTFSPRRWHPTLNLWRPHYGVDFAAPTGTPIKAAADGVVTHIGWSGGYGRMVELDNVGAYSTRYGHMSRFVSGMKKGDRVTQGQVIGYVGETGEASGPHLHFEIRVHDKPFDPMKVALPDSSPLPKKLLAGFQQDIQLLTSILADPASPAAHQRLAALDEQHLTTASVSHGNDRDL